MQNKILELAKSYKENLLDKHLSFDTIRKIYLKNHPNY